MLSFESFAQGKRLNQNSKKLVSNTKASSLKKRGPASDPDAPIEVRGQSRNLNMLLILQNQDEIIDFIKLRKDYQDETKKMNY
jgi:hypothetical protein